uniref:RCK C-terminal domain-containing protein n=1 Tax=Acrobeloides nanus TaxID=290746 RepID=A0A914DZW6_9BILA
MIIIVILYTIIGAYFIRYLEATKLDSITIHNLTEENDSNIYSQSKIEVEIFEYWTTQDAVLFAFSIITTIGVNIWFGGKKLTLQQLIKNLGDQLNLDSDVLDQLDLDSFVENAIKVEAGELSSLRNMHIKPKRPVVATDFKDVFSEDQIMFIDEDEFVIVYTFKKRMELYSL